MSKKFRTAVLAIVMVIGLAAMAQACPTCKEAVSENGGNLVQGYFWSIIFMMSMPFLILAGLSTMFYLDVRRARARKMAEAAAEVLSTSTTTSVANS